MTERMLAALSRFPVALFAIDEAHCISQWGPAFRPEYAELCRLRERFPGVPIAALTATADEVTREDIAERLFGGEVEQFVLGFDRPNITLAVQMKRDWKRQLQGFIARHEGESGIVYCLSRKKTEALLAACGVRALPYHAGMDTEAREEHQNVFMTEPGVVIVAHHRLWHGDRQGGRALRVPHRPAGQRRGVLPGDRAGRARRGARRGAHALRPRRQHGNKEAALKLGARYGAGGWFAPPGVDLRAFRERGWL